MSEPPHCHYLHVFSNLLNYVYVVVLTCQVQNSYEHAHTQRRLPEPAVLNTRYRIVGEAVSSAHVSYCTGHAVCTFISSGDINTSYTGNTNDNSVTTGAGVGDGV
jgi:hypothetical protein